MQEISPKSRLATALFAWFRWHGYHYVASTTSDSSSGILVQREFELLGKCTSFQLWIGIARSARMIYNMAVLRLSDKLVSRCRRDVEE